MTDFSKKYWNFWNIAGYTALAMFFIADRLLKTAAVKQGYGGYMELVGGLLRFRLSPNSGLAFSINSGLPGLTWLISGVILALLIYLSYLIINKKNQRHLLLPLTFIIIGAISNVLDRILFGAVIDYLDVANLTVLNLSDVLITIGLIVLFIQQTTSNHADTHSEKTNAKG
ncbi:MAG: signal peptidase II [Bacillota bacterium]